MICTKIHNSAQIAVLLKQLETLLIEDNTYELKKAVIHAILQATANGIQRLGEITCIMLIYGSILLIQNTGR